MNYDYYLIQHIISINIILYVNMIIFYKLKIETLLALYNPFDPFFNFLQFFSYIFIHSIHIFLHITFNMLILLIWGMQMKMINGPIKFIIIYFTSGVIVGLLQNMLKILIVYHYSGILDLYKISHRSLYLTKIQRMYLQYSMYSPLIGSSGVIASIIGSFTTIKLLLERKIFIINFVICSIIVFFKLFPSISYLSHFSGAITGYYFSISSCKGQSVSRRL